VWRETAFLGNAASLGPIVPIPDDMSMGHWWKANLYSKIKVLTEKPVLTAIFTYHISHISYPGIEGGPPQ
jgi:hypothetical protein